MSQIVASTYEITEEIGSGGGGVVYLGQHLRLGKTVVLKADKRKLSTRPEILRREVDALKNLSHTYIPQVYDFVEEDGKVYTVMDYIEGESLDKPLKRGERFPQSRVIEWACQLLQALEYLHTRPPHGILHSDIKPANIMLTPQGDIRLIDFNIALALGAEGAVRVGYSKGYASPEHYNADHTPIHPISSSVDMGSNASLTNMETVAEGQNTPKWEEPQTERKRAVYLDVRSDIYSLGATLYHLFSGVRPAKNAAEVMPLSETVVSASIAAIINKAMAPDPDQRYQSAAEMLYAFEHLHETDPRARSLKRKERLISVTLTVIFLLGGLCTFGGLKQMQKAEEAAKIEAQAAQRAEQIAKEALAAVGNAEGALLDGDVSGAITYAMEALQEQTPYFTRAQKALAEALGVYDLADGFQSHLLIHLPSEPLKVVLSPQGTRTATLVSGSVLIFDTESGKQLAALAADASALSDIVFVNEDQLLYAGDGALRAYSLSEQRELWSGKPATSIALSADGSTAAAIYKDENLAAIYDVASGAAKKVITFQNRRQEILTNDLFADRDNTIFELNEDGSLLAVSFSDGALKIFDLNNSDYDIWIYKTSDFKEFEGGFWNQYFAFSAIGDHETVFTAIDTQEKVQTGGFSEDAKYHAMTDQDGVYISRKNLLVQIDPLSGEQKELACPDKNIADYARSGEYTAVITVDGSISVFGKNAALLKTYSNINSCNFISMAGDYIVTAGLDTPALRVLKHHMHEENQLFSYDSGYLHNEARIHQDGSTAMLFRYDSFRLYASDGTVLAEVEIPDANQVYDQQFRRDENGSRLDVIYYSGLIRSYSAKDGSLLKETISEPPDESLRDEFFTRDWRITAPLHGTPLVYDKETGEQIGELDSNAYLTYVTQIGDHVIAEYITAEKERYGVLLNSKCETLAILPDLCDILDDGRLIFDDMMGNLRETRIHSVQELISLAEKQQEG